MKIIKKNVKDILPNPENPRVIKDAKYKKLVKSIKEFPEMLNIRPIVLSPQNMILGGNQRYKACIDAGLTEVPVIIADNLTEAQQKEFALKDNISSGDWDWLQLAQDWEEQELDDWGLNYEDFQPKPSFQPTLIPNTSYDEVTEERIKAEAEKLAKQMVSQIKHKPVICPDCGYEFEIENK